MKYELHPHQSRALDMLRDALRAGVRHPMVQAPTGFGKTLLAAAIIEGALAKGRTVLFVVPFVTLVDQTKDSLAEQGIHNVGVIQGIHPDTDPTQPVQVASLQTLQRRKVPKVDLVIIDEAHRWFEFLGDWMADPAWAKIPFVGLSATPWTKGLGRHYNGLLVAATTAELIEKGFLSKYRVFAPAHPDLSKVRTARGDFHEGDLSEAMSDKVLIAGTVSTWLSLGEDRPTLLFAVDRAHARRLADEFEAAGVSCGYVDANTPRDERARIGERLRLGQIKVVANVGCLTTGVDWDVRCIILARPTKSEMLFCQIIGRGLRTAPGKDDCLILDHSDTTLRLGFPSDIHHETLDGGKHQTSETKAKDKPPALPKECPKCSFLKPAGIRQCSSCGFTPERQSEIEERDGSLVQLNGKRKKKSDITPHDRQQFYGMCIAFAREKNHDPGSAGHLYKDRFGVFPRGLRRIPVDPDSSFRGWIASRNIAWRKAKEKAKAAQTQGASHAA